MSAVIRRAVVMILGVVVLGAAGSTTRADNALFTFGEMRELQKLPADAGKRSVSDEEIMLYRNMEFYAFTVFESLIAANNAAISIHDQPLFCAPEGAFRFREDGDITGLVAYVTDELLAVSKEIGARPERFHDRPASEVLLLGLRTAFPCGDGKATLSAMR